MKTYVPSKNDLKETWYVVDAAGQTLGRLCSRVAGVLRGKHRPDFTPFMSLRDHVIIINAEKIVLTGRKLQQKKYYKHSGHPGGIKSITAEKLMQKKPELILRHAIWGMLPKNKLGKKTMTRVRIFAGEKHNHQSQKPQPLSLAKEKQ